jgi:hypothetical protein
VVSDLCSYCSFAYSALASFRMGMSGRVFSQGEELLKRRALWYSAVQLREGVAGRFLLANIVQHPDTA